MAVLTSVTMQSTKDAISFYKEKVDDLGKNLIDLEKIVQGKGGNLKVIEDGRSAVQI